jgi:hypothetical protein
MEKRAAYEFAAGAHLGLWNQTSNLNGFLSCLYERPRRQNQWRHMIAAPGHGSRAVFPATSRCVESVDGLITFVFPSTCTSLRYSLAHTYCTRLASCRPPPSRQHLSLNRTGSKGSTVDPAYVRRPHRHCSCWRAPPARRFGLVVVVVPCSPCSSCRVSAIIAQRQEQVPLVSPRPVYYPITPLDLWACGIGPWSY